MPVNMVAVWNFLPPLDDTNIPVPRLSIDEVRADLTQLLLQFDNGWWMRISRQPIIIIDLNIPL